MQLLEITLFDGNGKTVIPESLALINRGSQFVINGRERSGFGAKSANNGSTTACQIAIILVLSPTKYLHASSIRL